MKKFFSFFLITLITTLIFLTIDFFLGEKLLVKFKLKIDNTFRIQNNFYHHGFKKNYKTNFTGWGPYTYTFCTNSHGFRSKCNSVEHKKYDVAFIGDSFTEGVGLNYEDTFVGIIENLTQKKILNLGIVSSSPSLYLKKLNYILNKGIHFDDLIVAMDLSDIYDELSYNETFKSDTNKCKYGNQVLQNKTNFYSYIKYFLKDNLQITYTLLKKLWWEFNFRKINKNFNLAYLEKNFYRSAWPYNNTIKEFRNKECLNELIVATELVSMEIYSLLRKHGINLSILIYPWPGTLIHDNENSKYVEIWKNFCFTKCKTFLNSFPIFFDELNYIDNQKIIDKYYFKYDVHFNKKGNKLLANFINKNFF